MNLKSRLFRLQTQAGTAVAPVPATAPALRKRLAGDWQGAVAIWETLADSGCSVSMERLAKYHEHVSKDLAAARRCCTRLPHGQAQQQRRDRIDRKLQRQGPDA